MALTPELPPMLLLCSNGLLGCDRAVGWDLWNRRRFDGFGGGADAQLLPNLRVELGEDVGVVLEEGADVFAALADAVAVIAVPGAGFLDNVVQHGQIKHVPFAGDALAVEDVELGFAEGGGDLVLDDLDLGAGAGDDVALLDSSDAADIDANRGVELERAAAGGGLRIAEHDADLFADLVDEDKRRARFGD